MRRFRLLCAAVQRLDVPTMKHMLIFGLGFTAGRLANALRTHGWTVDATGSAGNLEFGDEGSVHAALLKASHVLSSVPPNRESGADDVLLNYGDAFESRQWLGYLSSTGVYGDAKGAWVDEATPTVIETGAGRRNARAQADADWIKIGARVFRLPGIYGPERSALDRVRNGKARRIDMPGQIFSRVHVDDIVSGVIAAIETDAPAGAYNLSDDLPASGNAVTEEACRLLRLEPPPMQTLDEASLSEMARGFYSENRRVANGKAKRVLGWEPAFSSYKEGLASLLRS